MDSGKNYLFQIAQIVPSAANVENYCKIVREKHFLRTLIQISKETIDSALDGGAEADKVLDAAEQKIYDIRKGKTTGGYCTYFSLYKAPFIFSNFNGTEGDVNVLTHEGGHALQAYLSSDIKVPEYHSPTLESCEIHSMSMEFFAYPWMNLFFGKDEEKYKYTHLKGAITFVPYGACVDEFQTYVYENYEATPKQRREKWLELHKQYEPHLKFDELEYYKEPITREKAAYIIGAFGFESSTSVNITAAQDWYDVNSEFRKRMNGLFQKNI
jgi:oligoendopeptidase F